ncbi:hypothetical protein SUGI_0995500 [Cryptomeria japonica]|nr:hypothetical protein SUGI_0995500 [Cryptomeria japonica]
MDLGKWVPSEESDERPVSKRLCFANSQLFYHLPIMWYVLSFPTSIHSMPRLLLQKAIHPEHYHCPPSKDDDEKLGNAATDLLYFPLLESSCFEELPLVQLLLIQLHGPAKRWGSE